MVRLRRSRVFCRCRSISSFAEVQPAGHVAFRTVVPSHAGRVVVRGTAPAAADRPRAVQADHRQAELELDVARLAVGEFENGMLKQTLQDYQGRIALAKSDLQRGADRLEWSKRMLAKGYVSAGQVTNEEYNLARTKLTNAQMQTGLQVFQCFSVPRTLRELKSRVYSAESWRGVSAQAGPVDHGASRENRAADRTLHHPCAP